MPRLDAGLVRSAVRRRMRRHRRRGGILMYHRVVDADFDPWGICVSPKMFDEQMQVLAQCRGTVDAVSFSGGDVFGRSDARVAVTFDDGYLDNVVAALPILERHEIPATIFVIGNAVGRTREFWWDALERAILAPAVLPGELEIVLGADRHRFTIGDSSAREAADGRWRADADAVTTDRQRLFVALWNAIVVLDPDQQDQAVDELRTWSGQPGSVQRIMVDDKEFDALVQHPLITVGSHTLDHLSLTDLSPRRQREQIHGGHRRIEELAGRPVTCFSFPFGRFDDSAVAAARELGVDIACTSVPEAATVTDDRHTLPRLQALDIDGDAFARWLRDDHRLLRA
ncbi:polysaccharide deacetylase family protein [Gordonia sp. (in: high G+C Gram-positive bacteria)]|uniref:polysaccharide deacetylase family protein n=1 Tax=Gordonia sp. (in: high G+C Gram-positive bacteria) TaxID=84139 RepID=UPI001E11AE06|nr:polysaccharide deacetylase family protein [Gordonia sp. (in: high G+C Gram-positive bacteria)]MCB1293984.1 polysaccharide deacetylase family protein [Gordonia sp. (in: high G+C Gram-positive bacteria)]HMS75577.1 polysaccharide deacetylase family protein [Gordonia sp. (in: high G+C Gram-positive bacteria)]